MLRTRAQSEWISVPQGAGWGSGLASVIDDTVHRLAADRDVITVSVAPITALGQFGSSPTVGVIVTVAWRHNGPVPRQ